MTNLIVRGGRALRGTIIPSANKNAVLPVLCATLLSDEPIVLHRVPDIPPRSPHSRSRANAKRTKNLRSRRPRARPAASGCWALPPSSACSG